MHFDYHFTAVQVLWTPTFASLVILLVVLSEGRDRIRRFLVYVDRHGRTTDHDKQLARQERRC